MGFRACFLFLCFFSTLISTELFAGKDGNINAFRDMVGRGELFDAAKGYYGFYEKNKGAKQSDEALAMVARILDSLQDKLTENAEKKCYWVKSAPRTPDCMHKETAWLNKTFGENSFKYTGGEGVAFINYTGEHYKILEKKYKRSPYADEAEFYILLNNLIGMPDDVVPRVEGFVASHKDGYWNRVGSFLLARVNEDVWHVWKKWTWVIYNKKIGEDELIVKAEPYRQAALRILKELAKKDDFIGKKAASEYAMLNAQEYEGTLYSITNASTPGTWQSWGLNILDPPRK